jgi:SAM-dependent methyltransferase
MNKTRNSSFWEKQLLFIDKLLSKLRFNQVLNNLDLNWKVILDTWSWYNAYLLQYLVKNKYKNTTLIAYDLKLNKKLLHTQWIETIEWDLNNWIILNTKVDIVFSTAIIEHLHNPELYIKTIYDTLNEKWFFILTTPTIYSKPILEFLAYNLKLIDKTEILDHKKYYEYKTLIHLLSKSWFDTKKIRHKYFQFFMNNYCIIEK